MDPSTESQPGAIFVARRQSRRGEPLNVFGDLISVKLGGQETGGRYALLECVTAPGGGPPLHVHHREDEGFYILEGDFVLEAGGKRVDAHTGDFVLVRRDVPHRFRNVGTTTGTILLTAEPAGLEDFFAEMAAVAGPPDAVAVAPIFAKYGQELLGPPLEG